MSRSRTAFLSGTITDNPLTNVATTINSAALASLPAIASPDIAVLVLDPTGSAGAPEVVYVTAHTGSATSATISRGKEGSSARQHASGIAWVHGPTLYDFKGWRLEGEDTAEYTTTSVAGTDVVTISGLLIPVTQWVEVSWQARRGTGASTNSYSALKVNSTYPYASGAPIGNNAGATNVVAVTRVRVLIPPRSANYLNLAGMEYESVDTTNTISFSGVIPAFTALPNATITSMSLYLASGHASVTAAVKNFQIMVRDA